MTPRELIHVLEAQSTIEVLTSLAMGFLAGAMLAQLKSILLPDPPLRLRHLWERSDLPRAARCRGRRRQHLNLRRRHYPFLRRRSQTPSEPSGRKLTRRR